MSQLSCTSRELTLYCCHNRQVSVGRVFRAESLDGGCTSGVSNHRCLHKVSTLDIGETLVWVGARLELGDTDARAVELANRVRILAVVVRVWNQVRRPHDRERSPSRPSAGMIFGKSPM